MAKSVQGGMDVTGSYFFQAEIDGWVFPILGSRHFSPEDPANPPNGWTAADVLAKNTDTVSFSGTLSGLTVYVWPDGSNVRITTGRVVVFKNGIETALEVEIPPSQGGYFVSDPALTLDFQIGDEIQGRIYLPVQDEDDPDFVWYDCYIGGVYCAMETNNGHYGVVRVEEAQTDDGAFATIQGPLMYNSAAWGWGSSLVSVEYPSAVWTMNNRGFSFLAGEVQGDCYLGYIDFLSPQALVPTPWPPVLGISVATARGLAQHKVRVPGTFMASTFDVTADAVLATQSGTSEWFIEADGTRRGSLTFALSVAYTTVTDGYIAATGTAAVEADELVCYGVDNWAAPGAEILAAPEDPGGVLTSTYARQIRHDFLSDDTRLDVLMSMAIYNGWTTSSSTFSIVSRSMTGSKVFPVFCTTISHTTGYDPIYWDYVGLQPPFGLQVSNLRVKCAAYSGSPIVFTVLVDGIATDQTITVNGTGWFEDTVNVTQVAPTESVCFKWEVPTGTFTGVLHSFAWTQQDYDVMDPYGCTLDCPEGMSRATIIERTQRMLGEDPDNPVYWTNAEIGRYVSDAYSMACRDTKFLQHIESVTLVDDQAEYTLTDRTGQVLRVTYDDRVIPNVTKWEHDRTQPDWEAESGYIDGYMTTLQDSRKIRTYKAWDGTGVTSHWPFGGTVGSASTAFLNVWSVKSPLPLTADCDEPELPQWSHLGLCFAAAAKALRKYGEMRNEGLASVYEAMALGYFKALKSHAANRTPERLIAMGRGIRRGVRRPMPYDEEIVD